MKITLAYGTGDRGQAGDQPDVVWEGDDGQGDDELPASLCRDLVPELDVGVWHRVEDIMEALPEHPPASNQDTAVRLHVRSAEAMTLTQVQIPMLAAVHNILVAVLAVANDLSSDRRRFLRVE